MKVVRNQLAEGGRLADAQRSLYDLIWMGVRDKVGPLQAVKLLHHCFPLEGEARAGGDYDRGAY